MRVGATFVFAAGLCLAQEASPTADQAVQDEKIRELERRMTVVETVRLIVDANSNRITRLETTEESNHWWITGLLVPVALLGAKAVFDLIPKRKNGSELSDRLKRMEDRLEKWQP